MSNTRSSPAHPLIASDRVEGTAVYDRSGHHLGSIKRLMIEKVSGQVVYAIMSFGGIMGLGEETFRVPWAKLQYDTSLGGYRTDITESELRGAPSSVRGDSDQWPGREEEDELQTYFRIPADWRSI
ncbi:MAG: PRC-barrel domain-containing protein [Acetobacteraceae bacterium]|nr:PRC-barrel domain-containing protein [Acetobacteraceae bacterium]MBV8522752.1 PRC-barrel domain-containing protein [Acetobacteraceae bacterium]